MIRLLTEEDDIEAIINGAADWWSYYPDEDTEEIELDKMEDTHKEAKSLIDELFDDLPDIDYADLNNEENQNDYDELEHQENLLYSDCMLNDDIEDEYLAKYQSMISTLMGVKIGGMVHFPSCLYFRFFDHIYKVWPNVYNGSFYITAPNEQDIPEIVKSLI